MTKLTLQINSLEALERLIGGDSEVEVSIRGSVAQQFTERHLKALANSEPVQKAINATRNEIIRTVEERCANEIATFKSTWGGSIHDIKLAAPILAEINSIVRNLVDDKIRVAVDAAMKDFRSDKAITDTVNKRFEYYTDDFIKCEIKRRIENLKKEL